MWEKQTNGTIYTLREGKSRNCALNDSISFDGNREELEDVVCGDHKLTLELGIGKEAAASLRA